MNRKYILGLGLVGVGAAAAYFGRQWLLIARAKSSAQRVIPDEQGNYDIDGVSFDRDNSEVIVSGDATHGEDPKRAALLH
jgi:hypothetical protein